MINGTRYLREVVKVHVARRSTRSLHQTSWVGQKHQHSLAHLKHLEHSTELLNQLDAFIFDCDGVIWKGDTMISNADKMLKYLRSQGKRIFFFTNSSMKSRTGYMAKFHRLGIDVLPDGISTIL